MSFHPEILSTGQRAILPSLGAFATAHGCYLGGGTAVALYLGHRRSVDFDWFAREGIADPLVLAEQARNYGLRVENAEYAELAAPLRWEECSVDVASLDDLACMKLAAIAQRGSRKDFIDLYYIALDHKPISEVVSLYKQKYRTEDIAHLLTGLGYFDDADEEPSPVMIRDGSWDQIKRQFEAWTRAMAG